MLALYRSFPDEHSQRFLALSEDDSAHHAGFFELLICIKNGSWKPQKIPVAVAEVWLDDHKATPWLRCKACQLLLPKRRGFWLNTQTGAWWQGAMKYFADCPSCHGEIGPRGEDASFEYWKWQPLRPEPPWEFLDEAPVKVVGS